MRELGGLAVADGVGPLLGKLVGQSGEFAPSEGRPKVFGGGEPDRGPHRPIRAPRSGESEAYTEGLLAEPADRGARGHGTRPEQEDRFTLHLADQEISVRVGYRPAQGFPGGGTADENPAGRPTGRRLLGDEFGADAGDAFAPIEQGLGGVPFLRLRLGGKHDRGPPAALLKELRRGRGDASQA